MLLFLCWSVFLAAGLNDGLIAHYEFEGNGNDSSGNSNHGEVRGAGLTYEAGIVGQAALFESGYLFVDNPKCLDPCELSSLTEWTISTWIKLDNYSPYRPMLSHTRQYLFDSRPNEIGYDYAIVMAIDAVYNYSP